MGKRFTFPHIFLMPGNLSKKADKALREISMRIKILKIAIGLIVYSAIYYPAAAHAQPYQPPGKIQIQTELSEDADALSPTLRQWTAVFKSTGSGSGTLSIFPEGSGRALCSMSFSGKDGNVVWDPNNTFSDIIQTDHLMLAPGFPAPCDILPVAQMMETRSPRIYEVRRQAGGRTFMDRLQVDCFTVDAADARQKGWLSADESASTGLLMIRVINLRTNALMVQQLWSIGESWWRYEETPSRRSWLTH